MRLLIACATMSLAGIASPIVAQETATSQVAVSTAGQVGQRQSSAEAAVGIELPGRIDGRINTRIQARIRNRIDRYYDPNATPTAAFKAASGQARR